MNKNVIKQHNQDSVSFNCPGCGYMHTLCVGRTSIVRWSWNGNLVRPTFSPSILVSSGHYAKHWQKGEPCRCTYNAEHPEEEPDFKCVICHSFITDGKIKFLTDCTHSLAGQEVPLPILE